MHVDDRGVDLSIQLEPIAHSAKTATPRRRILSRLLVACAILLSLSAMAAFAAMLVATLNSRGRNVTVTGQNDPAANRAEAVAVFEKYDPSEDSQPLSSPSDQQERESIASLFHEIESYTAAKNNIKFRRVVDFDRLMKRIQLTGNMDGLTELERRYLKTEIEKSTGVQPHWGKILVAGIVAPIDEPNSRIVYAFGRNETESEHTENRFWISRSGNSWKLYDWERLDLGISKSQHWGICCKYHDTPEIKSFGVWSDLIAEADALAADGKHDAAKEKLRLAESQTVPAEFEDYCLLLAIYRWAALGDAANVERCCKNVKQPDNTPGTYYNLMNCKRWRSPSEALKYAQLYEATIGPTPNLLEVKAPLLQRLHRKREAVDTWKQLVRIQPDNSQALTQLYLALPNDDKAAFVAQLARTKDPAATVAGIASSIGYRDYQGLLHLIDYLKNNWPESPKTLYVMGFAKYADGRYSEAAELYRRAYQSESDVKTRDSYVNAYIEAMVADGEVIAALKGVPDPKSSIQSLLSNYDDDDVSLTDEDYRQVIDLFWERYPTDSDAAVRKANLATKERRYEEAESILRQALEKNAADAKRPPKATDERAEELKTDHDSLVSTLALILYQQGKLNEAFESGREPTKRFNQLTRQALLDERWDDVRVLLDVQRATTPDDPQIHLVSGQLAAHEKKWDEAIQQFQAGLKAAPAGDRWQLKAALSDACVESDKWLEFYKSTNEPNDTFAALASRLAQDKNWDGLTALVAEHRKLSGYDLKAMMYNAEVAWAREDYATYTLFAEQALRSGSEADFSEYERKVIESRRLSALLRSRQFDRATELAETKLREDNESGPLAIVDAATGKLTEANSLAHDAAADNDGASELYFHDDVGPIFLAKEFRDLQQDFPVQLPFAAAPTQAVFLFDGPFKLDAADVAAALKQVGVETTATAQPLATKDKRVTNAFAISFDKASISLVAGAGKFDDQWKLDEKKTPLASTVNNCKAWLTVGTAAWTEANRHRVEVLGRRIAGQLAGGHASIICVPRSEAWQSFIAYPIQDELIHVWQRAGDLKPFGELGVKLESNVRNGNAAANRQFDRSLRQAVRTFQDAPGTKLQVWGSLASNPTVDLLPLEVASVRRLYGSLEFDGTLRGQSQLIAQLQAGLPMRFQEYRVQGWQLNDDQPVYRP